MFSYVSAEERVPKDHPLRTIRPMVDAALRDMSKEFDTLYSRVGRPSIPPERLFRALWTTPQPSRQTGRAAHAGTAGGFEGAFLRKLVTGSREDPKRSVFRLTVVARPSRDRELLALDRDSQRMPTRGIRTRRDVAQDVARAELVDGATNRLKDVRTATGGEELASAALCEFAERGGEPDRGHG